MTKDKDLEIFFSKHKPQVHDDSLDFMAALNHKLNAVEYIKQYQQAKLRRYKLTMLVTFIVGILCGGALIAYINIIPAGNALFDFNIPDFSHSGNDFNWYFIITSALAALIGVGVVGIARLIVDLSTLKQK